MFDSPTRTPRHAANGIYRLEDDRQLERFFQTDKTSRKRLKTALAFLRQCSEHEETLFWEQQAEEVLRLLKQTIHYYEILKKNDWTPPEFKKHSLMGQVKKKYIREDDWRDLLHLLRRLQAGKQEAISSSKWQFAELCQLYRILLNPQNVSFVRLECIKLLLGLMDMLVLRPPPPQQRQQPQQQQLSPELAYLSQTLLRNAIDLRAIAAAETHLSSRAHQAAPLPNYDHSIWLLSGDDGNQGSLQQGQATSVRGLRVLESSETVEERADANAAIFDCVLCFTLYENFKDDGAKMQLRPLKDFQAWYSGMIRGSLFPPLFSDVYHQSSVQATGSSCPLALLVHIEEFVREALHHLSPPFIEELWRGPPGLMEEVLRQCLAAAAQRGHHALSLHVLSTYTAWVTSQLHRPSCMQANGPFSRHAVILVSHTLPLFQIDGTSSDDEDAVSQQQEVLEKAISLLRAVVMHQEAAPTDAEALQLLDLALQISNCYFTHQSPSLERTSHMLFTLVFQLLRRPSLLFNVDRLAAVRSKLVGLLASACWWKNHSAKQLVEDWGVVMRHSCNTLVTAINAQAEGNAISRHLEAFDHLLHLLRPVGGGTQLSAYHAEVLSHILQHVLGLVRVLIDESIVPTRDYAFPRETDSEDLRSPMTFVAPGTLLTLMGAWLLGACELLDMASFADSVFFAIHSLLLLLTTRTYEPLGTEAESSILQLTNAVLCRGELKTVSVVLQHGWAIFQRDVPGAAPGLLKPFLQASRAFLSQDSVIISSPGLEVRRTREAIIKGLTTIYPLLTRYGHRSLLSAGVPGLGPLSSAAMHISGAQVTKEFAVLETVADLRPLLTDMLTSSLSSVREDVNLSGLVLNAAYVSICHDLSVLARDQQSRPHGPSSNATRPECELIYSQVVFLCKACTDDHTNGIDLVLAGLDRLGLLASCRPALEVHCPESVAHVLKQLLVMAKSLQDPAAGINNASTNIVREDVRFRKLAALYEVIGRWLMMDKGSRYTGVSSSLMDVLEGGLATASNEFDYGKPETSSSLALTRNVRRLLAESGNAQSPREEHDRTRRKSAAVAEVVLTQLINYGHNFPPPQGIDSLDSSTWATDTSLTCSEAGGDEQQEDGGDGGDVSTAATFHLVLDDCLLVSVAGLASNQETAELSGGQHPPPTRVITIRSPYGTFCWRADPFGTGSDTELPPALIRRLLQRRADDRAFRQRLCMAALETEEMATMPPEAAPSDVKQRRTLVQFLKTTSIGGGGGGGSNSLMATLTAKLSPRSRRKDSSHSVTTFDGGHDNAMDESISLLDMSSSPVLSATMRLDDLAQSPSVDTENPLAAALGGGAQEDGENGYDRTDVPSHGDAQVHQVDGGPEGVLSDGLGKLLGSLRLLPCEQDPTLIGGQYTLQSEYDKGRADSSGDPESSSAFSFIQTDDQEEMLYRVLHDVECVEELGAYIDNEEEAAAIHALGQFCQDVHAFRWRWNDVKRREAATGEKSTEIQEAALSIWEKFLKTDSPCTLLLKPSILSAVQEQALSGTGVNADMFDTVQREAIAQMLQQDKVRAYMGEADGNNGGVAVSDRLSLHHAMRRTERDLNNRTEDERQCCLHNKTKNGKDICQITPVSSALPFASNTHEDHNRLLLGQLGLLPLNSPQAKRLRLLSTTQGSVQSSELTGSLGEFDRLPTRQQISITVLYVATGQQLMAEDILNNTHGRGEGYHAFMNGLGWTVDLCRHRGYAGKLTAPPYKSCCYYADDRTEVVFHVVRSLPPDSEENKDPAASGRQADVLADDVVQVVWCEHARDYPPATVNSGTANPLAVVVVYPLQRACQGALYRIQVYVKDVEHQGVAVAGPLTDGMTVSRANLAPLVRQTAVNLHRQLCKQQQDENHLPPAQARRALVLSNIIERFATTEQGATDVLLAALLIPGGTM